MESYREMRERQQKEFNELPLGFAFSDEQFNKMMEGWGLNPEKKGDLKKIVKIPYGGFVQKKDRDMVVETMKRHSREMEEAKKQDTDGTGFLYQMFLCELDNHEYGYTGGLSDTLDALNLTVEEVNASPAMLNALHKATTEIQKREGC